MLFPEEEKKGDEHDGHSLLLFKKGAFYLSAQSNMKILPVVVQRFPNSNHPRKYFQSGDINVKLLKPIEKEWFENIDDYTMRGFELMNDEYRLMNQ